MVAHQAVGVADPVKLFDDPFLETKEFHPILLAMEDRHPSDAPVYGMVKGAFKFNTQSSSHFYTSVSS